MLAPLERIEVDSRRAAFASARFRLTSALASTSTGLGAAKAEAKNGSRSVKYCMVSVCREGRGSVVLLFDISNQAGLVVCLTLLKMGADRHFYTCGFHHRSPSLPFFPILLAQHFGYSSQQHRRSKAFALRGLTGSKEDG